ncbi:hypothetical protein CFOL_v3_14604 [Cephalotus follicularis]|uniref:Uncharacterized protein n=1 Tax=Cephalotus follicularis TaxID=3775 RepID=A0A1Q3BT33_CEPFO|nr:hypothetical protein CFOL_v3_14604 [Cephalotus follicularis]
MSYQDLYIMWHVVIEKPLNLLLLIMKNMLRASSKVKGVLPYGMVITKIIAHFGILPRNEVPSRIDVGDFYNTSSLKRMGWKRVFEAGKGNVWLPKEGGWKRRIEEKNVEEQGEPQRLRTTPAPQQQASSSSSNSQLVEMFMEEIRKMNKKMDNVLETFTYETRKVNIKMDNLREELLDLSVDQRRRIRRIEKKMIAKGLIEAADISSSESEEEEEGGGGGGGGGGGEKVQS